MLSSNPLKCPTQKYTSMRLARSGTTRQLIGVIIDVFADESLGTSSSPFVTQGFVNDSLFPHSVRSRCSDPILMLQPERPESTRRCCILSSRRSDKTFEALRISRALPRMMAGSKRENGLPSKHLCPCTETSRKVLRTDAEIHRRVVQRACRRDRMVCAPGNHEKDIPRNLYINPNPCVPLTIKLLSSFFAIWCHHNVFG